MSELVVRLPPLSGGLRPPLDLSSMRSVTALSEVFPWLFHKRVMKTDMYLSNPYFAGRSRPTQLALLLNIGKFNVY